MHRMGLHKTSSGCSLLMKEKNNKAKAEEKVKECKLLTFFCPTTAATLDVAVPS